jgi:hypothetical protein
MDLVQTDPVHDQTQYQSNPYCLTYVNYKSWGPSRQARHTHATLLQCIILHINTRREGDRTVLLQHIYSHIRQKKAKERTQGMTHMVVLPP